MIFVQAPHYRHLSVSRPNTTTANSDVKHLQRIPSRRLEDPIPAASDKMQFWGIGHYEEQKDKQACGSGTGSHHDLPDRLPANATDQVLPPKK